MFLRPDGFFYVSKAAGELSTQLVEKGYKVLFFQSYKKVDFTEEKFSDYRLNPSNNLKIVGIKRNKLKLLTYLRLYWKGGITLLRCDFLYMFYPDRLFYLCFIAKYLKKEFGIYIRGSIGINSELSKKLYKGAGLCCTVSPLITEMVNKVNKNCPAKTISPLIDFKYSDYSSVIRKFHKKEVYHLLFVGRVVYDKGIVELIDGVAKLAREIPVELHIVGDGEALKPILKYIDELSLNKIIHFYGHINDLRTLKSFYENMDVLCLSSYHEGFPRVLYEAMIFKLPILTTFVGAIPYLMRNEYNCYQIDVKSSDSIYLVLKDFLSRYSTIASLIVRNASDTIKKYLSENSMSQVEIISDYLNKLKSGKR
jgi:glycosyltransferase involved in cell wall biosynthesis